MLNRILILAILCFGFATPSLAADYPKLANYYLRWTISDYEARELAKWDVLVLDMEVQENSHAQLEKIRELNPDIIILAYITSQEIMTNLDELSWGKEGVLRHQLLQSIDQSFWLKDKSGNRASVWPGTAMLNLSSGWNEYLPQFVNDKIIATGLWDGVFYDNIWGDIAWANGGNFALGSNPTEMNTLWANGTKKMLMRTRELIGNKIIIGNGNIYLGYQPYLNGMMLEDFVSSWESGGTWSGSLNTYRKIGDINRYPQVTIINSYNKDRNNYQEVRFGLASALLDDNGYFSFDYDNTNHGQLWWYDEYDFELGAAKSQAYDLKDKSVGPFKASLWRRDFTGGTIIINSAKTTQSYVFKNEEFQKLSGTQDPLTNSGAVINWIKLAPSDAVFLLNRKSQNSNNFFYNGYYSRVFDNSGKQLQTGFFSYLDRFAGGSQVITQPNNLINTNNTKINIYNTSNQLIKSFEPFPKSTFNLAFTKTDPIIAISGSQVKTFDTTGKLLSSFYAYDKNRKANSTVAYNAISKQIITGAAKGYEPEIKIFDSRGKLIKSFLAYDKKFKGGISVAICNGDIVVAPGPTGGPHLKIFTTGGKLKAQFMAYNNDYKDGVKVICEDLNADGQDEILASIPQF